MKDGIKTTIIIILVSIAVILSLTLAFVVGKKYSDMKCDAIYGRKEYQLVGDAFSGVRYFNWPEEVFKRNEYFDPTTLYHKVEVPKILIETEVTSKMNEEIYNNYSKYIEDVKNNGKAYVTYEIDIDYNYKVKNDILFILVKQSMNSSKLTSSEEYDVYYYDIKNDKELTTEDICTLFNITNSNADDTSIKDIYAVMPNSLTHFDIYYNQNEPCSTAGCKSVYTVRNVG